MWVALLHAAHRQLTRETNNTKMRMSRTRHPLFIWRLKTQDVLGLGKIQLDFRVGQVTLNYRFQHLDGLILRFIGRDFSRANQ